jgi:poly-gamma-glutamate synthesis protein (capsule biosynthesis protein)
MSLSFFLMLRGTSRIRQYVFYVAPGDPVSDIIGIWGDPSWISAVAEAMNGDSQWISRRRLIARWLRATAAVAAGLVPDRWRGVAARVQTSAADSRGQVAPRDPAGMLRLFLSGDVMTGRGIDQILPHPSRPEIFESFLRSATDYVQLAEESGGPIERPVTFDYIWGDALAELARRKPDARIINLETAVTAAEDAWPAKGIHYRMHPGNLPGLVAARIDCCVLANNHVLDWGYAGLRETLETVHAAGIVTAGAGPDEEQARAPAIIGLPGGGRVLVYAFAMRSSGVPEDWAARPERPGVNLLRDLSPAAVQAIARHVEASSRRAGDVVVASIHWGANWGYEIPREQRRFAHELIDTAGVHVVHGHSSHHPLGIEVYRERLILYGCGDFLNDYEGIGGHEAYRPDLALMYLPALDPRSGRLNRLDLVPMQIRRLRLNRASGADAHWLARRLTDQSRAFGTSISLMADGVLNVRWNPDR